MKFVINHYSLVVITNLAVSLNTKLFTTLFLSLDDEFATLKNVIKDLVAANEEKEMRIDELRKAVTTYQRVEEIILSSRSPRPKSEADEVICNVDSLYSKLLHFSLLELLAILFPKFYGWAGFSHADAD